MGRTVAGIPSPKRPAYLHRAQAMAVRTIASRLWLAPLAGGSRRGAVVGAEPSVEIHTRSCGTARRKGSGFASVRGEEDPHCRITETCPILGRDQRRIHPLLAGNESPALRIASGSSTSCCGSHSFFIGGRGKNTIKSWRETEERRAREQQQCGLGKASMGSLLGGAPPQVLAS